MQGDELLGDVASLMPGFLYIYEVSPQGEPRIIYASKRVEEFFGATRQELSGDIAKVWARIHPDDLPQLLQSIEDALPDMQEWRSDFRVVHPTRGVIHLQGRSLPKRLPDGTVRWHGFHHDVTEARTAQEALKLEGERLRDAKNEAELRSFELEAKSVQLDQLFALSSDLLAIWHPRDGGIRLSEAWANYLGASTKDLLRTRYDKLIHSDDLPQFIQALRGLGAGRDIGEQRTRWRRPDGRILVTDWRGSRGEDGLIYIVARDVTETLATEQRLQEAKAMAEHRARALSEANRRAEQAALHDALTGLANRRYFGQWLAGRRGQSAGAYAVLHLDLDGFKEINDRFGHPVGDEVLRRSAAQLADQLEEGDFLARIGGDEFVAISERFSTIEEASEFGRRLIDAVASPFLCGDWRHRVGVSVGLAFAEAADADLNRLRADADIALYRAKANGGSRLEVFEEQMRLTLQRRQETAKQIESALRCEEFIPYFQPQICAETGEVIAVEALARWRHPVEGVLPPFRFIAAAEEMGRLADIDRQILHHAWRDMEHLRRLSGAAPRLSVNVSARRLADPDLIEEVRRLAPQPGSLCFELVESILFDELNETVRNNAQSLRSAGVEIELDDFGSGHASIIALTKLRPSRLKIDRRLVAPIANSAEARALVESIIGIGRTLGVGIVAEGVEDFQQARLLAQMGCPLLQGYAFSKPVSFQELSVLLDERPWLQLFNSGQDDRGATEQVSALVS